MVGEDDETVPGEPPMGTFRNRVPTENAKIIDDHQPYVGHKGSGSRSEGGDGTGTFITVSREFTRSFRHHFSGQ